MKKFFSVIFNILLTLNAQHSSFTLYQIIMFSMLCFLFIEIIAKIFHQYRFELSVIILTVKRVDGCKFFKKCAKRKKTFPERKSRTLMLLLLWLTFSLSSLATTFVLSHSGALSFDFSIGNTFHFVGRFICCQRFGNKNTLSPSYLSSDDVQFYIPPALILQIPFPFYEKYSVACLCHDVVV